MTKVKYTQLHRTYERTANMTAFAGFEMPLWYKGITPEHLSVRNSVGLFDISHMGRVTVTGGDAGRFLNHITSNDVAALPPGSAHYTVMCNEKGGIIDDFVLYHLEPDRFLVVFNAGNREKDYNWVVKNAHGFDVRIEDISDSLVMLAVQGPNAERTLQKISQEDLSQIGRFKCGSAHLAGVDAFLSRTGYTGEDGFEVFVWNSTLANPDNGVTVWRAILDAGKDFLIEPCGLGARDTLRLEAGLCLYGNDIDESTTPLEAGLGFVVKLQKDGFIGKDELLKQKSEGIKRKRVGVKMIDKGIPRPGFDFYGDAGEKLGRLTSGTFSPLLKYGVGMAYVQAASAQEGAILKVKIRDRLAEGRIASFPLYDPNKYGHKRKPQT